MTDHSLSLSGRALSKLLEKPTNLVKLSFALLASLLVSWQEDHSNSILTWWR
jgi:hypothetical protein